MSGLIRFTRMSLTLGGTLVLLVAGAGLADAAGAAAGARAPGWRVTARVGTATQSTGPTTLLAVGPNDAFATFFGCRLPCRSGSSTFTLSHWNGRNWRKLPFPAKLDGYVRSINSVRAIGASGPDNLWIFKDSGPKPGALRWNGHKWSVQALPSWAMRINGSGDFAVSAVMTGPNAGWLFSAGLFAGPTPTTAARLVSGTWVKAALPQVPWAVGTGGNAHDLWVVGIKQRVAQTGNRYTLMHWDGRSWHTLAVPKISRPRKSVEYVGAPAIAGPGNLWLTVGYQPLGSGDRPPPPRVLHWNGKTWSRFASPPATSFLGSLAPDGHGGLWALATGTGPRPGVFFEHLRNGRWSRQRVPGKGTLTSTFVMEAHAGAGDGYLAGRRRALRAALSGRRLRRRDLAARLTASRARLGSSQGRAVSSVTCESHHLTGRQPSDSSKGSGAGRSASRSWSSAPSCCPP